MLDSVKTTIRNWNEYEGCIFGEKVWGHYEDNEFIVQSYKKGDFPVVWCNHDGKCCDAIDEDWCSIKKDHENE